MEGAGAFHAFFVTRSSNGHRIVGTDRRGAGPAPSMSRHPPRRRHWLVVLAGVVLLIVLFVRLGPDLILERLTAVGWSFPVIVALFAGHEATRALALQRCLLPADRLPLPRLLWIQFVSDTTRTLTQTGPVGAEPVRGWLLVRDGIS